MSMISLVYGVSQASQMSDMLVFYTPNNKGWNGVGNGLF